MLTVKIADRVGAIDGRSLFLIKDTAISIARNDIVAVKEKRIYLNGDGVFYHIIAVKCIGGWMLTYKGSPLLTVKTLTSRGLGITDEIVVLNTSGTRRMLDAAEKAKA